MIWPTADRWRAPVDDFPPRWVSAWGDDVYGLWADLEIGAAVQRLRWIEPSGPGGFWMGSTVAERAAIADKNVRHYSNLVEDEPHRVVVGEGFWLADGPCTQAFWMATMQGDNPSYFAHKPDSPQRPVEQVSWDDVQGFLAELVRLCPALAGRVALPTEVEWEYAARAGTVTAYPWGDKPDDTRANWGNRHVGTTTVGRFEPNAWGLYDMHGNVWHWCADSSPLRPATPPPQKQVGHLPSRAVRGGSWAIPRDLARSAFRDSRRPLERDMFLGFRLALRSSSPGQAR